MRGSELLARWRRTSSVPGGAWLFSRLVGLAVPYSGTIRARIRALDPGRARVELPDRRRVRNHLRSIHAIALVNLGELTSGLALLTALPDDARGIVRGLSVDFAKKARGALVATCECAPLDAASEEDFDARVEAEIRDADGDVVATVRVDWRVGPRP